MAEVKHIVEGDTRLVPNTSSSDNGKVLKVVGGTPAWSNGESGTTSYADLTNKPKIKGHELNEDQTASELELADAVHRHAKSDITDFPVLAVVATSGSYNDLSDQPSIPTIVESVTQQGTNGVKSSGIWTFVKNLLPSWLTPDYDEPATAGSVSGKADKVANATQNNFAALNASGNLIDSTKKATDFAESVHTHTKSQIDDFPSSMPPTSHQHAQSDVSDLEVDLAAKRDKTDMFTEWVCTPALPSGYSIGWRNPPSSYEEGWCIVASATTMSTVASTDRNATNLHWNAEDWERAYEITATRRRILTTGDKATLDDFGIVKPDGTTVTAIDGVISAQVGLTGHTVTFVADTSERGQSVCSAYFYILYADGSSELRNCYTGTSLSNVIFIQFGKLNMEVEGHVDFDDITVYSAEGGGNAASSFGSKYTESSKIGMIGTGSLFQPCHLLTKDLTVTMRSAYCFLRGTLINTADGRSKRCEDITYDDNLLVWDFDNGRYSSAKPLWIRKCGTSTHYWRNILDDGTEILTTGTEYGHRFFCPEEGRFLPNTELVGKNVFTRNGIRAMKSVEHHEEMCEYYNIVTNQHINCFTNGVLASTKMNNIYSINDMRFVKDGRMIRPFDDFVGMTREWYDGFRVGERNSQNEIELFHKCESNKKAR